MDEKSDLKTKMHKKYYYPSPPFGTPQFRVWHSEPAPIHTYTLEFREKWMKNSIFIGKDN